MNINTKTCLSDRAAIDSLIASAGNEKLRVLKEMNIADKMNRSDLPEWKARYLALIDLERALSYLAVNVTLTAKIPLL